jgi:hypothetical protein
MDKWGGILMLGSTLSAIGARFPSVLRVGVVKLCLFFATAVVSFAAELQICLIYRHYKCLITEHSCGLKNYSNGIPGALSALVFARFL